MDLLNAIQLGDIDKVKDLLARHADVNMYVNATTPLIEAAYFGRLEITRLLLGAGSIVSVNTCDLEGNTALYYACEFGHTEIIKNLLRVGADPNAKSENGNTPLIIAAQGGYVDIVKMLLAEGADVNATNRENETALFLAELCRNSEAADILRGISVSEKFERATSCS